MKRIGKADLGHVHGIFLNSLERKGKKHPIPIVEGVLNGSHCMVDQAMVTYYGSLDILGLSKEPALIQKISEGVKKFGLGFPSTRSLIDFEVCKEIEKTFAIFKGEDVSFMNTGFTTSESVIEMLVKPLMALGEFAEKQYRYKTQIYFDHFAHASLQSAIKNHDPAMRFMYGHQDYDHLERLLDQHSKKFDGLVLIVVDALYSMTGSFVNCRRLAEIAKLHGALVVMDGAHSDGAYGPQGKGVLEMQGIPLEDHEHFIQVGVLSKVFCSIGGYVTLPQETIEFMKRAHARYMFTVGRPMFLIYAEICALEMVMGEIGDQRRSKMHQLSAQLREMLREKKFNILNSESHIVPIIFGNETDCYPVHEALKREFGLFVNPIPPSVVAKKSSLLRISVTADLEQEDICKLVEALVQTRKRGFNFSQS